MLARYDRILLGIRRHFGTVGAPGTVDNQGRVGDGSGDEDRALDAGQDPVPGHHHQGQGSDDHHRQVNADRPELQGQWQEQRAQPENEKNVGCIGTGNVAHRQRSAAHKCCPTASSGMLVPIDTTLRPINIGGIPIKAATLVPARMSISAPTTSPTKPDMHHIAASIASQRVSTT
jgi:hypothetical protein